MLLGVPAEEAFQVGAGAVKGGNAVVGMGEPELTMRNLFWGTSCSGEMRQWADFYYAPKTVYRFWREYKRHHHTGK